MSKLKYLFVSLFVTICSTFLQAEQTLSIIKPDGVRGDHVGEIIARFEKNGLHVAGMKMIRVSPEQAGEFYADLKSRPFFPGLVKFMSSSPVVVMVLDGDNAVKKNRELMGATDPKNAVPGTIRADLSKSIAENTVHGSDSSESAKQEIPFFFKPEEIFSH
jgi:nucleoside-diphosphate kinase